MAGLGIRETREQPPRHRQARAAVRGLGALLFAIGAASVGLGALPPDAAAPSIPLALDLDGGPILALAGLALLLATFAAPLAAQAARVVAALVVAIAGVALVERLVGLDAGVDALFVAGGAGRSGGRGTSVPLAIALLGFAILVARRNARLSHLLALLVAAGGTLAAIGYLYGLPDPSGAPARIPVLTAALLIAASLGALFLRPESGVPAALLDRSEAGRELRRLLPAALLLPVALGWLVLAGEGVGLYRGTAKTALFAIALVLALFALASISYRSLRRSEDERRRVRQELSASEARYRRTFEQARIGIAHLGPDGRWLRVNEHLCAILGYEAAELLGKTYAEVSHLDDLELDVKQWELLRRGEIGDYAIERRFETKRGELVHADARLTREEDEAGALRHVILVLQDITGRKLSEGTLRVYERALEATQNGVVITDARANDQPIVYANPAFLRITGYALSELLGRNCRLLNEKSREQAALDEVRRAISTGEACSVLLRNHRKQGEAFWNQLSIAPVEDAAGRVTHFVGVIVDATERVQALAEREELHASAEGARREAEAANRAKDRFLSLVSHELRSPLNAILAWTSLLRDPSGAGDLARAVEAIEASVQGQTRLVNDLLDASRIRSGTLEIEPARIDLEAAVRSAVDQVAPLAREREIALELATCGPAPAVADAGRIEQVVRNLVENALKFTPKGGRVAVALSEAGPGWRLEVADDGRGIAAEELPHVFDEFWQGERRGSGGGNGLGLGLPIVKHLVERHGGVVRVESEGEGRGTRVCIELRKAGAWDAPAEAEDADAPPDLGGVEVVVVDDDDATVQALGVALGKAGAIPRLAKSVPDALYWLERGAPEVLVSDIGLPERDGFDLIRVVRGSERGRSLLAIAVTGLAGAEERRRIRRAGFDAHLAKPIAPDLVVARLARLRALEAAASPPARRVLILHSDAGPAGELAAHLRGQGHAVFAARDAAEALREAERRDPHLVLVAASAELDAAALAEALAARSPRAVLVALPEQGADPEPKGFDLVLATPQDVGALDRMLRFAEET